MSTFIIAVIAISLLSVPFCLGMLFMAVIKNPGSGGGDGRLQNRGVSFSDLMLQKQILNDSLIQQEIRERHYYDDEKHQ